jgi:predicted nucleic acid-binding Zn ribbon protein
MSAKKNLLVFKSNGPKTTDDGKCVDSGDIGNLKYELYQRGNAFTVLHVFNDISKGHNPPPAYRFKKDISVLQVELEKIDFHAMQEDTEIEIKGSGDNDDLILKKTNGSITLVLKRRGFDVIEKLKDILKGKGVKNAS